ncbi:hypothetical protein BJ508DRAFT_310368 [Ascobolus immersus RN42]|uniref:Uncharacterized protein n=1 Tax=Ascobolus immersus RN42 TaxID=1160509 RepID=A0A3N4HZ33_ASCIM|nr:hypothetical protein BJ508DRAFT_310368 [Ascobolus immersus RN42]
MTTLPAFQIEGVDSTFWQGCFAESQGITGVQADEFDAFIRVHPEARLKYEDEDGDEVVVGSAAELLDRINELGEGPVVLQTVTTEGRGIWVEYMIGRTSGKKEDAATQSEERPKSPETEEQARPRTPEEQLEHTLFQTFQRDLERALHESLNYSPPASTTPESSNSQESNTNPTVESFLHTLTETLQATLSSVYPHASNITSQLRQNPALRQAAEVLQQVGHKASELGRTANETIQTADRKKLAEDVKKEVADAVRDVGTALGEAFREVGEAYVAVYKEIHEEVLGVIEKIKGGEQEKKDEVKTEQSESQTEVQAKKEVETEKRDLSPTVEAAPEVPEKKETSPHVLLEEVPTPTKTEEAAPVPDVFPLPATQSQQQSQSSDPAPPQPAPRPFSNRFGGFAGTGHSSFPGYAPRRGRGGSQIFMGPSGFQRHTPQYTQEMDLDPPHTIPDRQAELAKEISEQEDRESFALIQDKVDLCVAKLIDMGYDEVFEAERLKAMAVIAEGDVETAVGLLTVGLD